MAGSSKTRASLSSKRARFDRLRAKVRTLTTEWTRLEREAGRARRGLAGADSAAIDRVSGVREELEASRKLLSAARREADAAVAASSSGMSIADLLSKLGADVPLVLLPLRIETRFKTIEGIPELWIRVYPDTIHVDGHEKELTDEEVEWGQYFWTQYHATGATEDDRASVWTQLTERYGEPRAAWIVRSLTPVGLAPVVPNSSTPVKLTFPEVERRSGSWTRAPIVRTFPDKWIAIGFSGDELTRVMMVGSPPVVNELAVGPDPSGSVETVDGVMPIDPEMKWMVDFAEAERVGMATRIRLSGDPNLETIAAEGLDLLVVVGLRFSTAASDGSSALEELFDAHHFDSGMSFVRPGTPTNITESSEDPEVESASEALARELGYADELADTTNAVRLATALGIEPNVLAGMRLGTETEHQQCADMSEALWPATFGQYLEEMMTGYLDDDQIDWVRAHFVDHVRSRGPLPIVRVGNQPYGFLPTYYNGTLRLKGGKDMDERVSPTGGVELSNLRGLLQGLGEYWRRSVKDVPHLTRNDKHLELDLVRVLAMTALPNRFAVRAVVPRAYFEELGDLLGEEDEAASVASTFDLAEARKILSDLGIDGSPQLLDALYSSGSLEWIGPLTQDEPVSWNDPLVADYISWLAGAKLSDIRDEVGAPMKSDNKTPATDSLLYLLLRHAAMRVLTRPIIDLLETREAASEAPEKSKTLWEFVRALPAPSRLTLKSVATGGPIAGIDGAFIRPYSADAARFLAALDGLRLLSSAVLEQLMLETLGACSYRLDAWDISLMDQKLIEWRASHPRESYIGAYGWVEDLKPQGAAQSRLGYVHAPTMTHAATAAILRSGWDAQGAGSGSSFAVNLTSDRIRSALDLLDGLRGGQTVNQQLGYRFERTLHDLRLDEYVTTFRDHYPLTAGKVTADATAPAASTIASAELVDGLALLKAWQSGSVLGMPESTDADFEPLTRALRSLEDIVDATSDALSVESVHQLVQGNKSRIAATVEAASTGDAPIPELAFTRTPQQGPSLTHRLLLLLPSEITATAAWPGSGVSVRAQTEPALEAWLASQLGDPSAVEVRVEFLPPEDGGDEVLSSWNMTMAEVAGTLGIGALDFLAMTPQDDAVRSSEFDRRLLWCAWSANASRSDAAPTDSRLRLGYTRGDWTSSGAIALNELLELVRAMRRVLASARIATAFDLALPSDDVAEDIDLEDLAARADGVFNQLQALGDSLASLIPEGDGVGDQPDDLRSTLILLANLGVAGAFPAYPVGDEADVLSALYTQARSVSTSVTAKLTTLATLRASLEGGADTRTITKHHVSVVQSVFGRSFQLVPRFRAWNPEELTNTFGSPETLLAGNPAAAYAWLLQVARVRTGAARLERLSLMKQALRDELVKATDLDLVVGQLPYDGTPWAALPSTGTSFEGSGRVSLVAHFAGAVPDFKAAVHGLVIDEWTEKLPNSRVTSGLTFHFDAPGARAPNVVLLCTSTSGQGWTLDALVGAVAETYQRMKLRAVDTSILADLGHFLPAILVETDASEGAVGSDLLRGVLEPAEGIS